MSRILTSSKLIESVRKRAMIPTDTSVYKDEDILDILNEEIDAGLMSTLLVLHEEYLVNYIDLDFDSSTDRYVIPYRASGNKLREVSIVSSDGNHYELSRISLDQLSDYKNGIIGSDRNVFYVENNYVVLADSQLSGDKVRMYYYLRPNSLVLEKNIGNITNINRTTGVITLSNFPSGFSSLQEMDFVGKRSPNKIYCYDKTPLSVDVNTKTITFNLTDIPKELIVGDYLCMKEQTPVPNIPTEMHPLLAQRAAVFILEALGDTEGLGNAKLKLKQMEDSINNLIDDRVEGAPQKVKPRYSSLQETSTLLRFRRRRGSY
jgi:hypothetical protein